MRIVNDQFLLFWGSGDYLSNWHPVEFSVSDVVYQCVEQYMMAAKARMFGDLATEMKILQTPDPKSAKALGREVQGFDDAVWIRRRQKVVFDGCLAKFEQNPPLAIRLLESNPLHLVEASPYDRIWGIGMSADDARAAQPSSWQGSNLLGSVLMRVRTELQIKNPGGICR